MAANSAEPPDDSSEEHDPRAGDGRSGSSRDKYAGRRMGKFKIRGELGRGGMGVVLEAYDTVLERAVAIKFLPRAMAAQGDASSRFQREARAAAKLQHPHVVAVHDAGEFLGQRYLVMELLRGGSLQDALHRGRLSWREATHAVADACRGLEVAHRAGLVHRDIKPSNLMRGEDGRIKLADFGLARPIEPDEAGTTASGAVLGTPHYMSPEQCRSELADERSDIYSLGATYYALLTGRAPFPGAAPLLVMNSHLLDPVPDPRDVDATIPAECGALIRRAMAKAPERRHASAGEMLVELEAILARGEDDPRTPDGKTPANAARRQLVIFGGVLFGVVLAGFIVAAVFGWIGAAPDGRETSATAASDAVARVASSGVAPEADAPPFRLSGMASRRWRADDVRAAWVMKYPGITQLRVAPSGEFLVVLSGQRSSGATSLASSRCDVWSSRGERLFHADLTDGGAACDVSSDSRWLAVGSGAFGVRVWNTGDWTERPAVRPPPDHRVTDVSFADDATLAYASTSSQAAGGSSWTTWGLAAGRSLRGDTLPAPGACRVVGGSPGFKNRIATGGDEGALRVWRVENGREVSETFRTGQAIQILQVSGDGRHVAVGAGKYFALWDPHGGSREFAAPGGGDVVAIEFTRDDRFVDWATADSLRRLDVATKREIAKVARFPAPIVAFSGVPDSNFVLVATGSGELVLWWRDQRSESNKPGGRPRPPS